MAQILYCEISENFAAPHTAPARGSDLRMICTVADERRGGRKNLGRSYLSKKTPCRSRIVPVASQSWLMLLFNSATVASSRLCAVPSF
jgi:hypothetical protein